ncbi:hypothetical protein [Amycolatopsis keratiniphila]|uniref:Uncharacterized protein n=1 Tax=Amycolatopsis keratiniphila subsp. keratiniphila TaxID=227715 RepID=A0A1W2LPH9_9PSEU|nr:hypothetical protein [Amycolatopsis keratiniphila]OLZ56947.1 hypothetical protein BS330_16250 [Amycolatopsis keratiniphila subsp. nogabecina]ONF65568.1 hypothetical protein AVR91_0226860 [Amycolatopsis keratiniphila subsp. keratiniphila]SDU48737.1 hypothetical protein SAMN04489733_4912 [Amycolatopsis keratiniphila]
MSIARKDDRHNEDLVREISDGFNRALGAEKAVDEDAAAAKPAAPQFVITGDSRATPPPRRKDR